MSTWNEAPTEAVIYIALLVVMQRKSGLFGSNIA